MKKSELKAIIRECIEEAKSMYDPDEMADMEKRWNKAKAKHIEKTGSKYIDPNDRGYKKLEKGLQRIVNRRHGIYANDKEKKKYADYRQKTRTLNPNRKHKGVDIAPRAKGR